MEMATKPLASSRWFDPPTRWIAFLGFFGLLIAAAITVTDALLRSLFSAPLYDWADLNQLVYAIVIVACFPAGLLQGHNITIRFLGSALGTRATNWLEAFGALLTLIFFAFIAWQFVDLTIELQQTNDTTMTVKFITWPWWTVATLIIFLCVPIQAVVLYGQLHRAVTGSGPGGFVAPDLADEELDEHRVTDAL
ncbi:MAG: TRAP transporter small permease [Alphaproteobacteria bacterium]|nr:MAG: TRAP transporter small permease [Alphaproteobacteria bacterium]